ncbi:MAG: GDP-mannose pyrophosphorylase [Trebouxia sp. A1-2]|nr:MAG: GDP-mannose pyrophosphorylase [Trebouxia sp. A1-2]
MKALILVGGYGTRLRPLTLTVPKPIVDFANKPMIIHQIEALKRAGCDEVVLAINYQPKETEPMGTAGPLRLASDILDDGSGNPFFVLNSDVICDFPLKEMLAFHKQKGAEGTILVTRVEDPSKYGVVVMDDSSHVERFVEKPKTFVGDKINAGIYVLNPAVLERIELRPTSIEKETFPLIVRDKGLYAFTLDGYWMDVGQPKDYLRGLGLHLESVQRRDPKSLAQGPTFIGNNIVHPSAKIGSDCQIGPDVSIGLECVIGNGVRISNSVLLHRVANYARIADSIVGWGSSLGKWTRVEFKSVIGEDVHVRPEVFLNGSIVLPHKEIKESIMDPGTIIM